MTYTPDFDKVRNWAEFEADYRNKSEKDARSPSTIPTKICSVCLKSKGVIGGSLKPMLPGKATRYNPMVFRCRQCVDDLARK